MNLGERVRRARTAAGYSQSALADAARVPQPTVSRVEAGRRVPTLLTLQRLARALRTTVDDLIEPLADS